MATKWSHRVFALSLALLFFITAFGFTFFIIWQSINNHSSNSNNCNSGQAISVSKGKLAGTKLNGFTPVNTVNALKTTDLKVGAGAAIASASQTVTADYTGAVACSGIIFQSSLDSGQPFTSPLTNVIPGWQQGMIGMKVGGERRLLIPASLAYGSNPPSGSGIPANAALVFDITLHNIQ